MTLKDIVNRLDAIEQAYRAGAYERRSDIIERLNMLRIDIELAIGREPHALDDAALMSLELCAMMNERPFSDPTTKSLDNQQIIAWGLREFRNKGKAKRDVLPNL